jgi:hypothetical protein
MLTIGTLSFSVAFKMNEVDKYKPVKNRAQILAKVIREHEPDLLVCSGFTIGTSEEMTVIKEATKVTKSVVVIEYDKGSNNRKPFVVSGGTSRKLGEQIIGESGEFEDKQDAAENIAELKKQFLNREFFVGGLKCFVLHCGEINFLEGRNDVKYRDKEIGTRIDQVDIVINPTHDRMGNAGTLIAKRKFLSRPVDGKSRCYVSASNWNTSRGQKPSPTLHTVYVNGKNHSMKNASIDADVCEFRITRIAALHI